MTHTVANPIENQANEAGKLFAVSELDASRSFEIFARAIDEKPSYDTWIASRTDWVNGYTEAKPNTKGNSADQAFARFVKRLKENFPTIVVPTSDKTAALKKAAEREAKAEKLASKYADHSTADLTDQLRKAYELQAKNPTRKLATLKELEQVVKARTKIEEAGDREELKAAKARLSELMKACKDIERIEAACDVLDEANYEIEIS